MVTINVIILLAFVMRAHARELAANQASNAQDSLDKLTDMMSDKLVDKLIDNLFDWSLKASPLHDRDVESTTLGKLGNLALLGRRRPALAFRAHPRFIPGASGLLGSHLNMKMKEAHRIVPDVSVCAEKAREVLDDLDAFLGVEETTTRSPLRSNSSIVSQNSPATTPAPANPLQMKRTSGDDDLQTKGRRFVANACTFYQGLLAVRVIFETLRGSPYQPPMEGIYFLTNSYLQFFTFLGPFGFIAAFYALNILRDTMERDLYS